MIRHRGVQAAAIAALAALATACACLAPIYDRAIAQALLHTQLQQRSAGSLALTLTSSGSGATPPDQLAGQPPHTITRFFGKPAEYAHVELSKKGEPSSGVGGVLAATGVCQRLHFVAGHCPHKLLGAAISRADARNFGWHVGQRVQVADNSDSTKPALYTHLNVVGVFTAPKRPAPGLPEVGLSGVSPPGSRVMLTDDWVVAPETLTSGPSWQAPSYTAAFPLDSSAMELDDLAPLARRIGDLQRAAAAGAHGLPGTIYVHSALSDVADAVAHGRDQAHVTVPLLVVQLAVLAVVVFWLVLGAATEQRRPEVALARLRGRGAGGARRLLLSELVPIGVAGVLAGGLVAAVVSFPVRHWVLPGDAPFELRLDFWWVLLAALAVVLVSVAVAVVRVAREPVVTLLRRVPTRRIGWALGVVDALIVAATAVAVVAFFTGALTGPLAQAAPTLFALLVGLVLAHLVVPVGAALGGRLASGGHVGLGVGLLQVARRTSTRRVIALVTVASALLVFAADAYQVGDRNRDYAAQQQLGAAMVSEVGQPDVRDVVAALHQVDPAGREVTPVVTVPSSGDSSTATVAVLPQSFRTIALFGGQDPGALAWQRLDPPDVAPIRLHGGSLSFELSSAAALGHQFGGGYSKAPGRVLIRYDGSDGHSQILSAGKLPATTRNAHRVSADVPCEKGCVLTGIGVAAEPGEVLSGSFTIRDLTDGTGKTRTLGAPADWTGGAGTAGDSGHGTVRAQGRAGSGLKVEFDTKGSTTSMMGQGWLPPRLPALITGHLPGGRDRGHFSGLGLDAAERAMTAVASAPRLPGAPPHTRLVNLETLQRDGTDVDSSDRIEVWFARADSALLDRVSKALHQRGIAIQHTTTLSQVRDRLDASAPAWGILLALLVGAVGLAIAALVLVVVAVTGWRTRAKDLAALRMSGLRERTLVGVALAEQLPIVVLSVVAGAVCGVVGAHYSLPAVPLLPQRPAVSALDVATAWPAALAAAASALVVLCVVGQIAAVALARRATLERVREEV